MMKRSMGVVIVLGAMVVLLPSSRGEDKKPGDVSGKLGRLSAFVGTWTVTLRGNEGASTTSKVEWILGGRFLRDEYTTQDGKQGLILRTYDEESDEYRVWTFTQEGSQYQTGKWDAEANELKVVGQRGKDKVVTIAAVKDDDTIEWAIGVVDAAGKTIASYEGVNRRVQE